MLTSLSNQIYDKPLYGLQEDFDKAKVRGCYLLNILHSGLLMMPIEDTSAGNMQMVIIKHLKRAAH